MINACETCMSSMIVSSQELRARLLVITLSDYDENDTLANFKRGLPQASQVKREPLSSCQIWKFLINKKECLV